MSPPTPTNPSLRLQLLRLLNPALHTVVDQDTITLEASRTSLVSLFVVPMVLGPIPLAVLVYCFQDRLPKDTASWFIGGVAFGGPIALLLTVIVLAWMNRVCLTFDRQSSNFSSPESDMSISRDQVQAFCVQFRSLDSEEGSLRVIELALVGNDQTFVVAIATKHRLWKAATEFAASTGFPSHLVIDKTVAC